MNSVLAANLITQNIESMNNLSDVITFIPVLKVTNC